MEIKTNPVSFALKRIATEQFAIIEEAHKENIKINLVTDLRFATDKDIRVIAIFAQFKFEQAKLPFLLIEVSCHFQITEESWESFKTNESTKIIIPHGFMSHLTMLTVGTARGILHTKTEGTRFNQYILPTINVNNLIKDDVSFD